MEDNKILSGGVEELALIKEKLIEKDELTRQISIKKDDYARLEKEIKDEEQNVVSTTESRIRQERGAIESEYDRQISEKNRKHKSVEVSRETARKKAVDKRIKAETKDIKNENKEHHKTIRSKFKENKIPKFCDSGWFYSLFCTSETREFIIFGFVTVFMLAVIPNAVCYLLDIKWIYKILLYIGIVAVILAIYIVIFKITKVKDRTIFMEMKPLRNKIRENKKQIRRIKRMIKKDKDDSQYGLEGFDQQLEEYKNDIDRLKQEKESKLAEFDDTTAIKIKNEVAEASREKIDTLKKEGIQLSSDIVVIESEYEKMNVFISTNYEQQLGKSLINLTEIQKLENLIKEGKATNIAEAIEATKGDA